MSERNMSIVFSSHFDRLTELNSSFDKGVLRVCYVGKNRNNSFISKETFESCIDSIYNCPIVCRYDRELDEIGSHDVDLVKSDDGKLSIVNVTNPVGVIPESASYWWEEIEENDGSIHEYLCVEALLWKRQEAYEKIKEDGITDESMEITIKDGSMQDGVYVIKRFEFTAFCLLGTAEPCYESASLMVFSQDDFKARLDEMMREFKEKCSTAQPSQEVGIHPQNYSEGGDEALDEKKALMAQYGLTEDMLDFSLEDYSVEELTAKFEELKKGEPGEPEAQPAGEQFALAEQFREELVSALSAEKVETCFGEMSRYWYVDYDGEAMEVYCYDQEDWNLYGFTYSMNGDHVVIDFESKKRKKFAIADFDEGEQTAAFAAVYSTLSAQYTESEAQWAAKYQTASDTIASMESELNTLKEFKANAEKAEADQERENILSQFSDLSGIEAFEALRSNSADYSVEDLEEKCYAIRGRNQPQKFALQQEPRAPKLPIEKRDKTTPEPYGGIFAEYGIQRKQST